MKLKIDRPVIVEGKYDKIKLSSVIDAQIITTNGFSVFKDTEKRDYIKRLCESSGVIIATDSDSAGSLIRGHLKGLVPNEKIINVYIPQIKGKEKRKTAPSKEGFLGLEGTDTKTLYNLFEPYSGKETQKKSEISISDLYEYGLYGKDNSKALRQKLCKAANLPANLSSKALCEALCLLYDEKELAEIIKKATKENE